MNILTIVDWLTLNNIHHLLYFMRMVSYLRVFIVHLSHVAHPLNMLNHTYVWAGGHAIKAFKEIKHWVVVALLLTLTSINQAFNFKLDALTIFNLYASRRPTTNHFETHNTLRYFWTLFWIIDWMIKKCLCWWYH